MGDPGKGEDWKWECSLSVALEELEELQKVTKIVTKQGLEHVWLEFSQY